MVPDALLPITLIVVGVGELFSTWLCASPPAMIPTANIRQTVNAASRCLAVRNHMSQYK